MSVGISITSYAELVELCTRWAAERKQENGCSHYVCVTSVHGIILARKDPNVARWLNAADVATPDGMPVVWAMRSFGRRNQQRVYGPTLMLRICERAASARVRVFLYGGRDETLVQLRSRLLARYPDLQIAGAYAPPFRDLTPTEDEQVQAQIRDLQADIVFVGISTPKQERWMFEHRTAFPGVTLIGVGAAFDFHAGRVRQAPAWMQRNGLEWLFRLIMEPARLWRRYLLTTPQFIPLWAAQWWLGRRPTSD